MAMALRALGIDTDEDEVNKVMGARPMKGAAWEEALACAQHYGCRATLTTPATVTQLKEWTDRGAPVMIAWNPEGRDWSHASLVFDVTDGPEGRIVHVADPNIPNPEKTVREMPEDEFYSKWYEKWPNYLVRRPACAIDREITPDGRQMVASRKKNATFKPPSVLVWHGHDGWRAEAGTAWKAKLPLPPDAAPEQVKDAVEREFGRGVKIQSINPEWCEAGTCRHHQTDFLSSGKMVMASAPAQSRDEMIEKYKHLSNDVREFFGIPPDDTGASFGWGDGYFFDAHLRGRYKVRNGDELMRKLNIDPRDLRPCCSKWRVASDKGELQWLYDELAMVAHFGDRDGTDSLKAKDIPGQIREYADQIGFRGDKLPDWLLVLGRLEGVDAQKVYREGENRAGWLGELQAYVESQLVDAVEVPDQIEQSAWEMGYGGDRLPRWLVDLGQLYKINVKRHYQDGVKTRKTEGHFASKHARNTVAGAMAQRIRDRYLGE